MGPLQCFSGHSARLVRRGFVPGAYPELYTRRSLDNRRLCQGKIGELLDLIFLRDWRTPFEYSCKFTLVDFSLAPSESNVRHSISKRLSKISGVMGVSPAEYAPRTTVNPIARGTQYSRIPAKPENPPPAHFPKTEGLIALKTSRKREVVYNCGSQGKVTLQDVLDSDLHLAELKGIAWIRVFGNGATHGYVRRDYTYDHKRRCIERSHVTITLINQLWFWLGNRPGQQQRLGYQRGHVADHQN